MRSEYASANATARARQSAGAKDGKTSRGVPGQPTEKKLLSAQSQLRVTWRGRRVTWRGRRVTWRGRR
eukprot:6143906-Prymnesium_polylepis.1